MNIFKNLVFTLAIVLPLSMPSFANAYNTFGDLNDFTTKSYIMEHLVSLGTTSKGKKENIVPEGMFDVSFIYGEAAHTNTWTADTEDVLYNNKNSIGETIKNVSLQSSRFTDTDYDHSRKKDSYLFNYKTVKIFEVTEAFTVNNITFLNEDYLIAFDDSGYAEGGDFDDMILKATSATPIPGAVWLLGSGFLGLLGFKKRHSQS